MPLILHSSPLLWTRVAAMTFSCVAFSVAVHRGRLFPGLGDWCLFSWAFSFAGSLLVLLVELFGLQSRSPFSWNNLPITVASYAALLCVSASAIFPLNYLKGNPGPSDARDSRIVSTVFSSAAAVAYVGEVTLSRARPGELAGYMATAPGLLKVGETFVACIVFVFISDPVLYDRHGALSFCMAVYCVCFVVSAGAIVLSVCECARRLPFPFPRFLSACAVLAVLLYVPVVVVWPVFGFDPKHGGRRARPASCGAADGLCVWDKTVAIAALTAVNCVLYAADLIYSTRLVFVSS